MKWSELKEESVSDPRTAVKARIFLVIALLVFMSGIAGATFVMVDQVLRVDGAYEWSGISCLVGTLLITFAAFMQRFGTLPSESSYY